MAGGGRGESGTNRTVGAPSLDPLLPIPNEERVSRELIVCFHSHCLNPL